MLTNKQRCERLMKIIIFLEKCEGQGNNFEFFLQGLLIDNFYICHLYRDAFYDSCFSEDYPEYNIITEKDDDSGAYFTDADLNTQENRDVKIIILLFLLEIIKTQKSKTK